MRVGNRHITNHPRPHPRSTPAIKAGREVFVMGCGSPVVSGVSSCERFLESSRTFRPSPSPCPAPPRPSRPATNPHTPLLVLGGCRSTSLIEIPRRWRCAALRGGTSLWAAKARAWRGGARSGPHVALALRVVTAPSQSPLVQIRSKHAVLDYVGLLGFQQSQALSADRIGWRGAASGVHGVPYKLSHQQRNGARRGT